MMYVWQIVSEENASLKEILKNAVIVGDDGSIGDVSCHDKANVFTLKT